MNQFVPEQGAVTAGAITTEQRASVPVQADVDALRGLLDLMESFSDNDQRARYLLSCNWMRDRGAQAAERIQEARNG